MTSWIHAVSALTARTNDVFDQAKQQVSQTLGIQDPPMIMPYRGYGTPEVLHISGRVLQDEGIQGKEADAPLWENLWNMYRRFETDELAGAQVRVSCQGQHQDTVTNAEGFFCTTLRLDAPLPADTLWQSVDIELCSPLPAQTALVGAVGEVLVVSDQAEFGVISDIDDTIVHTSATDLIKMVTIAYLGNERTRRAFPGVASFYQALQRGTAQTPHNPIFYISSSAWNLYDLFEKFMYYNGIPLGPTFLWDMELSLENWLGFSHEQHKRDQIRPILERYPNLPFILIGDSGQKDAEIYQQAMQDFPGRIQGILIRDIAPLDERRHQTLAQIAQTAHRAGVAFCLFQDTQAARAFAEAQGWILPNAAL